MRTPFDRRLVEALSGVSGVHVTPYGPDGAVDHDRLAAVQRLMLLETTTLGLRMTPYERVVLDREWHDVMTPWGHVRVKLGRLGGEVVNVAPEHDDCLRVAREAQVPLKRVMQTAVAEAEALLRKQH